MPTPLQQNHMEWLEAQGADVAGDDAYGDNSGSRLWPEGREQPYCDLIRQ
jgi:hypothetical protein